MADTLRALAQNALELAGRDQAQRDAGAVAGAARSRHAAVRHEPLQLLDAERQSCRPLDRTRAHAQRLTDTAGLFTALGAHPWQRRGYLLPQ